jgi:predicted amidohydrolase YtcJ
VILENGLVRTLDPHVPTQRALAIAGERVAGGVGVHETALASPETIDLGGRVVVPGFSDAHVHFPTWALARTLLDLEGCGSLDVALGRIRSAKPGAGGWIRGRGWRGFEPTRESLDRVTGNTPAALVAKDGHTLWVNAAGLASAGLPRDGDGILREEEAWSFQGRHLPVPDADYLDAMRAGLKLAGARGVTAIHDKDGGIGALGLWRQLDTRTMRVWQSIPADRVEHLAALGLRGGAGDDFCRLGYLKVFMDGTLGSQTALMLDGSGIEITTRAELELIVRRAAEVWMPVAVHAIGDRANRNALDAFEATRDVWAPLGLRQRIEHAQLLAPEDIPRFAQLGVAASAQFSHAPSDRDLADRFWVGKTGGAYAYRSLWDSGAVVANGSDAPIEELDPLAGIRAAVRREWHPEQALTVQQAFEATCLTPAWLAGDERHRGKLIPGYAADLVVLDRDPWDDLDARVVATMVAGRWVHNPPPWGS